MTDHNHQFLPALKGQGGNHTPDAFPECAHIRAQSHNPRGSAKTTAYCITGPRLDHIGLQPAPALASGGAI
jgi:hypothetical protein